MKKTFFHIVSSFIQRAKIELKSQNKKIKKGEKFKQNM